MLEDRAFWQPEFKPNRSIAKGETDMLPQSMRYDVSLMLQEYIQQWTEIAIFVVRMVPGPTNLREELIDSASTTVDCLRALAWHSLYERCESF